MSSAVSAYLYVADCSGIVACATLRIEQEPPKDAARELRDRWLEHVNAGGTLLESSGKYDVTRALPVTPLAGSRQFRALSSPHRLPHAA
jgi:hypothetical protein